MAVKKKKTTKVDDGARKTSRLNLMVTPDLKSWVHKYCKRREKSISALVSDHLIDLRERERGECVEQI